MNDGDTKRTVFNQNTCIKKCELYLDSSKVKKKFNCCCCLLIRSEGAQIQTFSTKNRWLQSIVSVAINNSHINKCPQRAKGYMQSFNIAVVVVGTRIFNIDQAIRIHSIDRSTHVKTQTKMKRYMYVCYFILLL